MLGLLDDALDVDPAALDHDERLELLERIEHARSALDAQAQQTLALLSREGDAEIRAREWVREEIAAVLRLAPVTAAARLHDALDLVHRLPRTLDLLTDGTLTLLHCRALVEAVRVLGDDTIAAVEARVLPRAGEQTIGEFRRCVKRAVLALDSRTAETAHRDAAAERRVRLFAEDDGMATVWAYLRADAGAALMAAIDAHAAALTGDRDGDDRTADQRRADVLADLADTALATAPGRRQGRRPAVQVSVALSTLLGLDDHPAELAGHGPIPAVLARRIAADPTGTWRRLLTDSAGRLLDYGRSTYRPPADLREHVIAVDRHCTFPGCRRDSRHNDIDHIRPYSAGGTTAEDNLHPPCRRHHRLKHLAGWTVRRTGSATTWTSPTGREHANPVTHYPIDATADPPPF